MEFEKAKIIVGGDSGVGKTALVHLLCNERILLHPSYTVGCSLDIKVHVSKSDQLSKNLPYFMELWDIGGSTAHASVRSVFYQNLHGLILVYDCTNRKSQVNLRKWLLEVLGKGYGVNSEQTNSVKSGDSSKKVSLLSPLNSEHVITRLLGPDQNSDNHPPSDMVIPPVLVVGTKLDLLDSHTRRMIQRSRNLAFDSDSVLSNQSTTSMFSSSPSFSSQWSSLTTTTSSSMNDNHKRHDSVFVNLNGSGIGRDKFVVSPNPKDQKWNFATEQGFPEIILNCHSLSCLSPNSNAAQSLDNFFDEHVPSCSKQCQFEYNAARTVSTTVPGPTITVNQTFMVIKFKMASISMGLNCNWSPERFKRRTFEARGDMAGHLFSY